MLFVLLLVWLCGQVANMVEKFRSTRDKRIMEVIVAKFISLRFYVYIFHSALM